MKGVKFGNFHSWNDFSLILSDKKIGSPDAKITTVEIPGADGVLDISEYFGDIKYKNRTLSFNFSTIVPQSEFLNLFSTIQNAIHGKRIRIVLDDDPDFYYIGRISVSEWKADKNIGKITVDCDCEPYKYKTNKTVMTFAVTDSATAILSNLRKQVVPQFTSSGAIQIEFGGSTYSISSAGTFTVPEIVLTAGNNEITFTGTANVTVEYQEGGL